MLVDRVRSLIKKVAELDECTAANNLPAGDYDIMDWARRIGVIESAYVADYANESP